MQELLGLILFGVWVYGIVDVLVSDKDAVRSLTKWAWLAIVILVFPSLPIGACVWFYTARPARPFAGSHPSRTPRQPRYSARRAAREQAEDEADVQARIAERDRMLAQWAEEERGKDDRGPGAG